LTLRQNLFLGLRLVLLVALGPLLLAGCGSSSGGGEVVTGTATIDGQPLDGATLVFAPLEVKERIGGDTVITDAQGN